MKKYKKFLCTTISVLSVLSIMNSFVMAQVADTGADVTTNALRFSDTAAVNSDNNIYAISDKNDSGSCSTYCIEDNNSGADISTTQNALTYVKGKAADIHGAAATSDFSAFDDGTLNGSNSVILDPGCASNTAGTSYVALWDGKYYNCIVGTNVFASQYSILNAGKNTTHYILINSNFGDLYISVPGKYYSPAYNICPYNRGAKADGSDWTDNVQFTTKSTVVDSIRIDASVAGREVEIAGFTFTGNFYDTSRQVYSEKTTIKLTNALKDGSTANDYLFQINNSNSISQSNIDELYVKNLYIKDGYSWRLIGENVPAYVTFDGLYCDALNSYHYASKPAYIKCWSNDNVFTFKNSNFRNWFRQDGGPLIVWQAFNQQARGSRLAKIVFDSNIFCNYINAFDSANTPYMHQFSSRSYSGFEFKNNYVYTNSYLSNNCYRALWTTQYKFFYTYSSADTYRNNGSIIITGNTFNGLNPEVAVESSGTNQSKEDMTIDHNYTVSTPTENLETAGAVGEQITVNPSNGTYTEGSGGYWLDYAKTKYSDTVQEMTIGGTTVTDGASINVAAGSANTFDLTSVIVNNYGNRLTGYADAELTIPISDLSAINIPAVGTNIYLQVEPPCGTSEAIKVCVTLIRDAGYGAYIEVADDEQSNQVSWRGIITSEGTFAANFDVQDVTTRVGIIHMSKYDWQSLNNIKAKLLSGAADLDNTIATINAEFESPTKIAQVYAMDKDKQIYWSDEEQALTYQYNFTVEPDLASYAVMYVVYTDSEGNTQVSFSDVLSQTYC